MKALFTILVFALAATTGFGQTNFEPQILILSPNEITYDKIFEEEIASHNSEIKNAQKLGNKEQQSGEMENQPENIKIMMQNEIAFSKTLDFSKQISYTAEQYLTYRFFERFPNLLITLKDIKCSRSIFDLKKIADTQHFQYILNFPKLKFYKEGISKATVSVQLYDQTKNAILLDKEFIGDWNNRGFEFSCQDSSLICTINNALSQALAEVIEIVAKDNPTLQKEKSLAQQRYNVLINNYFSTPSDTAFINKIILLNDSSINRQSIYNCLVDENRTKFIAFYLEKAVPNNFKSLKDNNKDKSTKIISSKDITDAGFLDDIPQTYAYIVKGVKYKDKWYYQKDNATYFEAKNIEDGKQKYFFNLATWNFFKENSTDCNPDFWETNQFQKIKDLTKDPDWNKYGETIWKTEEANNRDYVGMYEIVADVMKKKQESENKIFDTQIKNTILKPFYEKLKNSNPTEFSMYFEHSLIFPKERDVVINPVLITNRDGIQTIHYYVAFSGSNNIYEWTYFAPTVITDNLEFGSKVVEQINPLTDWTFSYENLNNRTFWDKYILAKSGNDYKYLKRL
ncbi:hypothetical protein [Paludibacter jiangxiensis]|uniref:Uncharacterized protein n=1 Tax=Paludibacter jiangxiensis TaxID=681398 RepID=A0A171A4N0_9BACT|nr:hypothetical protein [Paludibacter jiangxiensis]GAT63282.1 hypothetical protein PJIAN_3599 [Paludibacter jiangxiensis]